MSAKQTDKLCQVQTLEGGENEGSDLKPKKIIPFKIIESGERLRPWRHNFLQLPVYSQFYHHPLFSFRI